MLFITEEIEEDLTSSFSDSIPFSMFVSNVDFLISNLFISIDRSNNSLLLFEIISSHEANSVS